MRYQLRHVPEGIPHDSGASTAPTARFRCGIAQSSFDATAFGVTFIFGSYSATSTTLASPR